MIEPSKEAIEAADYIITSGVLEYDTSDTEALFRDGLKAAYAIDFAQLQAERDQLRQDLKEARDAIERVNRSLPQQTIDQLRLALQEARGSLRAELEATQIALQESQQRVNELENSAAKNLTRRVAKDTGIKFAKSFLRGLLR